MPCELQLTGQANRVADDEEELDPDEGFLLGGDEKEDPDDEEGEQVLDVDDEEEDPDEEDFDDDDFDDDDDDEDFDDGDDLD